MFDSSAGETSLSLKTGGASEFSGFNGAKFRQSREPGFNSHGEGGATPKRRLAAAVAVLFPVVVSLLGLSASGIGVAAAVTALYFLVITMPLMSLYLARTYKNVVQRPLFVIDWSRSQIGASVVADSRRHD